MAGTRKSQCATEMAMLGFGNKKKFPPSYFATVEEYEAAKREEKRLSRSLKRLRVEQVQQGTERFLETHGKQLPPGTISVAERRQMWHFFRALDKDRSGHISVGELLGPLVGVGMASSEGDVRAFVNDVDTDHSGLIDFEEFILALEGQKKKALERCCKKGTKHTKSLPNLPTVTKKQDPPPLTTAENETEEKTDEAPVLRLARPLESLRGVTGNVIRGKTTKEDALPLVQLQEADNGAALDMNSIISLGRRQRLLEAIEQSLPCTARIEEIRHEELQLRQKLFLETNTPHIGSKRTSTTTTGSNEDRTALRQLQRERRNLQRATVANARLIAALDHAIQLDIAAIKEKDGNNITVTEPKEDDDAMLPVVPLRRVSKENIRSSIGDLVRPRPLGGGVIQEVPLAEVEIVNPSTTTTTRMNRSSLTSFSSSSPGMPAFQPSSFATTRKPS